MIKTYSKAMRFKTFEERFKYLKLDGSVGDFTFNGHRMLNQALYHSDEWKRARDRAIIRDNGCDLADPGRPIANNLTVHHINPITIDDILERRAIVFDLENLICVTKRTHNDLHYGSEDFALPTVVERRRYDTCPWRN